MSSPEYEHLHARSVALLSQARQRGVRFWLDEGQLRYSGPSGSLSREEISQLRDFRSQIIALLEAADGSSDPNDYTTPLVPVCAPLAFSQLAHWNVHQLHNLPFRRGTASVTRLRGRLNIEALQQSLDALVSRHDALRVQIVVADSAPLQRISASSRYELQVISVANVSTQSRHLEIKRRIDEVILEPFDVTRDRLMAVRLLRLSDVEHILIIAMEHIISDAASLSILLRDLLCAYVHLLSGREWSRPGKVHSFADYTRWQQSSLPTWLDLHGQYWNERLIAAERLRFPPDSAADPDSTGWGRVTFQIESIVKDALRAWCRQQRTTVVLSVFTAYAAAVFRWCDVSSCIIQYVWDGRPSIHENTIGYFASTLYLPMSLTATHTFLDLLNEVMREYCIAHEHADFSYIDAQSPRPEVAHTTSFNWIPHNGAAVDFSELDGSNLALKCEPVHWEVPTLRYIARDNEPMIEFNDIGAEIVCHVSFPNNRFSTTTMARFGHHLMLLIRALLEDPNRPIRDIALV